MGGFWGLQSTFVDSTITGPHMIRILDQSGGSLVKSPAAEIPPCATTWLWPATWTAGCASGATRPEQLQFVPVLRLAVR